jgi:flavodoxin
MKIGIIYYTRSGNTRKAAEILQEKLKQKKADVELVEIQHEKKPSFFKAGRAAMTELELPIKNKDFDLKKYDTIIVGSPTWAGRPVPYIKSYLNKAENIKGKKTGVFSTGASPPGHAKTGTLINNYLEKLGLKTTEHTLHLKMKKEQIQQGEENIEDFIKTVIS